MTGSLIPEVWCDRCGDRRQPDGECTLDEWREALSDDGWLCRADRDVCPDCTAGSEELILSPHLQETP